MTTNELNTIIFVETAKKEAPLAAQRTEAPLAAPKRCRPFSLSVMVYSPQSGYKIELEVEKNCNSNNEAVWKFDFKLSKKNDQKEFDLLVEVKFTASTLEENQEIAKITKEGLTQSQLDTVNKDLYPLTKSLGDEGRKPTFQERQQLDNSMRKVVTSRNQ